MESLGDLALKGAQPAEAREFYAAALSLYVRIPASHPMGLLKRKLACLCEDPRIGPSRPLLPPTFGLATSELVTSAWL